MLERPKKVIFQALMGLVAVVLLWPQGIHQVQADEEVAVIIEADADSYVLASTPTINYGTATTLLAQKGTLSSYAAFSYIRFRVSDTPFAQALLSIYNNGNGSDSFALYAVDAMAPAWSENQITYQNRPAPGVLIAEGTIVGRHRVRVNVTDYVSNQSSVTFILIHNSSSLLTFSSREVNGQEPLLMLINGAPQECSGICPP